MTNLEGKKLLILGGNPETIPLVEAANRLGVKTIVTSNKLDDPAKKYAWKAADVDGMDVANLIMLAEKENVDGVLVGVADILVPTYCKVCNALNLPCYATDEIVNVFSYKDIFKATFERFGIHGIPEYYLDENLRKEDIEKIEYPVMVKPVDGYSGIGMTVCYSENDLKKAVNKAKDASFCGRFIVEKYMNCDDVGLYYTFKEGECVLSSIFDRYTCSEQKGVSKVNLAGIYPSKHINDYFERMHKNAVRLFRTIGIKNGVLLLQAYFIDGEFYVYDTGFRLQGEAPHILIEKLNELSQPEMLVRFALTGSEGDFEISEFEKASMDGKYGATLWFLLKAGEISKIVGMDDFAKYDVIYNGQRFHEGDEIKPEWIGTEKQVFTRLYIISENAKKLEQNIKSLQSKIDVLDKDGQSMLIRGVNTDIVWGGNNFDI